MNPIRKITIRGYKSIRSLENLELDNLNVLVGANGAGKSNFISFFRLLARLMAGELNYYVAKNGGPDAFLFHGRKRTPRMASEMYFGNNGYKFALEPKPTASFSPRRSSTGTTVAPISHWGPGMSKPSRQAACTPRWRPTSCRR